MCDDGVKGRKICCGRTFRLRRIDAEMTEALEQKAGYKNRLRPMLEKKRGSFPVKLYVRKLCLRFKR